MSSCQGWNRTRSQSPSFASFIWLWFIVTKRTCNWGSKVIVAKNEHILTSRDVKTIQISHRCKSSQRCPRSVRTLRPPHSEEDDTAAPAAAEKDETKGEMQKDCTPSVPFFSAMSISNTTDGSLRFRLNVCLSCRVCFLVLRANVLWAPSVWYICRVSRSPISEPHCNAIKESGLSFPNPWSERMEYLFKTCHDSVGTFIGFRQHLDSRRVLDVFLRQNTNLIQNAVSGPSTVIDLIIEPKRCAWKNNRTELKIHRKKSFSCSNSLAFGIKIKQKKIDSERKAAPCLPSGPSCSAMVRQVICDAIWGTCSLYGFTMIPTNSKPPFPNHVWKFVQRRNFQCKQRQIWFTDVHVIDPNLTEVLRRTPPQTEVVWRVLCHCQFVHLKLPLGFDVSDRRLGRESRVRVVPPDNTLSLTPNLLCSHRLRHWNCLNLWLLQVFSPKKQIKTISFEHWKFASALVTTQGVLSRFSWVTGIMQQIDKKTTVTNCSNLDPSHTACLCLCCHTLRQHLCEEFDAILQIPHPTVRWPQPWTSERGCPWAPVQSCWSPPCRGPESCCRLIKLLFIGKISLEHLPVWTSTSCLMCLYAIAPIISFTPALIRIKDVQVPHRNWGWVFWISENKTESRKQLTFFHSVNVGHGTSSNGLYIITFFFGAFAVFSSGSWCCSRASRKIVWLFQKFGWKCVRLRRACCLIRTSSVVPSRSFSSTHSPWRLRTFLFLVGWNQQRTYTVHTLQGLVETTLESEHTLTAKKRLWKYLSQTEVLRSLPVVPCTALSFAFCFSLLSASVCCIETELQNRNNACWYLEGGGNLEKMNRILNIVGSKSPSWVAPSPISNSTHPQTDKHTDSDCTQPGLSGYAGAAGLKSICKRAPSWQVVLTAPNVDSTNLFQEAKDTTNSVHVSTEASPGRGFVQVFWLAFVPGVDGSDEHTDWVEMTGVFQVTAFVFTHKESTFW